MITNIDRQNGSIRTNGNMTADTGCFPKRTVALCGPTFFPNIINKHNAVANKAVVADCNEFANKTVALNAAIIANNHSFLDFCKGADQAVVADCTTIKINWLGH